MEHTAEIHASDEGGAFAPDSHQSADRDEAARIVEYGVTSWFQVYEREPALSTKVIQDYDESLHDAPETSSQWKAQSVLQWIESLAMAAEAQMDEPILVNGIQLSEPSFPPVMSPYLGPSHSTVLNRNDTQSKYMCFVDMHNRDPDGWLSLQHSESKAQLDNVNKGEESTAQIHVKQDFTEIMTNWLLNNWINPYPDDQGIAELAAETETNPTVVGNWLINARTRKWRPAIVKASKHLDRPAKLLLEDSINIFRGKPLRKLTEDYTDVPTSTYGSYNSNNHFYMNSPNTFYPPSKRFKPSI